MKKYWNKPDVSSLNVNMTFGGDSTSQSEWDLKAYSIGYDWGNKWDPGFPAPADAKNPARVDMWNNASTVQFAHS